jgi:hypothetical protein
VLRENVSVALTQYPDATHLMLATGTRVPVDDISLISCCKRFVTTTATSVRATRRDKVVPR